MDEKEEFFEGRKERRQNQKHKIDKGITELGRKL